MDADNRPHDKECLYMWHEHAACTCNGKRIAAVSTESVEPPEIRSTDWLDALDKALCALCDLRRAPQHRDDPMLMIDVDRTANLLRQRISDGGSASNEKLSHGGDQ